jgi:tuftelin-interacting protein 11
LGQGSAAPEPARRRQEAGKEKASSRTSTPGTSTPRLRAPPKAKYAVGAIESRGLHVPEAIKQVIVDATGAETKTLTSLSGFSTPTREASPSPGLEAAKATSRIKLQLQAFADAWDSTKDQELRLEQEETQLSAALTLHEEEIQRYNDIISAFERVTVDDSNTPRDWDASISRLQSIQTRFADSITDLSLPELTASCLETPFRRELLDWDPLTQPQNTLISSLQSISELLEIEKSTTSKHRKRTTYFESLLLLHWYPMIRTSLTKDWNVYDPDPAYTLIESWRPLLPSWLLYKMLHEIILPRLVEAVRRFPKSIDQPATRSSSSSNSRKGKSAPDLHTFLFDWWTLLSSEALQLDSFPELRSLVKQKVTTETWPHWKPLLGSRKPKALPPPSTPSTAATASAQASLAATDLEEISFRTIVEDWASEHNLLLTTSHKSDAFGRLLYRLHDAERRNRGTLIYLAEDIVFGAEDGEPYALDDRLVSMARGK